jgi:hypothetical protein
MDEEKFHEVFGQIVAKAWEDEEFKKRLLSDATSVFREYGADIPEGFTVKVMEDTGNLVHLPLPPRPDELDLEELEKAAGGWAILVSGKKLLPIDTKAKVINPVSKLVIMPAIRARVR